MTYVLNKWNTYVLTIRDNELQKPVAHTRIWLGKRESDFYENVWCPKSERLAHQIEILKILGIDLKMRYINSKWSNVMNCKEAKWKASSYVIIFCGRSYMFISIIEIDHLT